MAIIGVGGEKGGSGKSTIAVNIAAKLSHTDKTIAFIDADRRPSSERWYNERLKTPKPRMTFRRINGDIDETIFTLAQNHDYLIIDTGGMNGREMRYTLGYAHKFICPTQPSEFDLDSLVAVQDYVALAKPINPKLEAFFVLNRASNNPKSISNKNAWAKLRSKELHKMQLVETPIHDLEAWKRCAGSGFGVCEMDDEKAKDDLNKLLDAIGII